ncbi:MAG: uracil phosphoribosyltransferase [Chthoniobacteraceae bacterium]
MPSTENNWPGVTVIDHPLVRVKLTQIRNAATPTGQFRERLAEVATLMVSEVTRDLRTQPCTVRTPLADHDGAALARPLVIAPILRAGLGMLEGMLRLLPEASVAHIGLCRNEVTHRPESYYFKVPPNLAEADVLVVDPMLATGWSATAAIDQLKLHGAKWVRFVCLVGCPAGITQLRAGHPDVPIYTAAIDPTLNDRAYIVPGLGDAGDRYFGTAG